MATRHPPSPLLQARLEFLGVVRRGEINVFLEISNLSGLSLHSDNIKEHYLYELSETADINCSDQQNLQKRTVNKGPLPQCLEFKITSSDINGQETICESAFTNITDRSPDGKIRQVPYTVNRHTKQVFDIFEKLKIPYETEVYKPKQERQTVDSNVYYCKNLFLKDRNGQFYLVISHEDFDMDLKQLRKTLNACRNFNFGTADDMRAILGTEPGGVTPLALTNPNAEGVKMVIHKSLMKEDASLMFHPFDSKLATKITLPSLLRYLKACNHTVTFVK